MLAPGKSLEFEVYTTFEGDNTVLMQLVAKSRLTEFKQEFSNMDLFGIFNYVADQAKTSLTDQLDWGSAIREPNGSVDPSGLKARSVARSRFVQNHPLLR